MTSGDHYKKFRGLRLDEEAFRRRWGAAYDDMIERRDALAVTGHPIMARRLEEQLVILDMVFMTLEDFRVVI